MPGFAFSAAMAEEYNGPGADLKRALIELVAVVAGFGSVIDIGDVLTCDLDCDAVSLIITADPTTRTANDMAASVLRLVRLLLFKLLLSSGFSTMPLRHLNFIRIISVPRVNQMSDLSFAVGQVSFAGDVGL